MGKSSLIHIIQSFRKKRQSSVPLGFQALPGPHPLILIGNLHQVYHPLHEAFNGMAARYGPVFELRMGSQLYVIINDDSIVHDLVIRGGVVRAISSSRYIPTELTPSDPEIAPFGTYWRIIHSLTRKAVTGNILNNHYQNIINREVRDFMLRLQQSFSKPFDPTDDLGICVVRALATMTYGNRSEMMALSFKRFYGALAKSYAMNANNKVNSVFPWLSRASSVKKHKMRDMKARIKLADTSKELVTDLRNRVSISQSRQQTFAAQVLKSVRSPNQISPLPIVQEPIQGHLEDGVYQTFDEYDSLHLIGLFLFGGTGATGCQLRWIFAQLSYLPRVQYNIQRELYKLVGQGKFPESEDYEKLPYLRAVIKECLRFRPLGFVTVPHGTIADDVYRGYHVPADSLVLVNTHPLHFSPSLFDRPKRFLPERFLDEQGQLLPDIDDWKDPWSWAKGPQACIGKDLAERIICTVISFTLTLFTIQREIDPKSGQTVEINMQGEPHGHDLNAPSYRLRFVPRQGVDVEEILQAYYQW